MNPGTLALCMQKYLVVRTRAAGNVRINCRTGRIYSERKNLDPILRRSTRKYLIREGFVEQALGILDPELNESADLFLDDISN